MGAWFSTTDDGNIHTDDQLFRQQRDGRDHFEPDVDNTNGLKITASLGVKGASGSSATVTQVLKRGAGQHPKPQKAFLLRSYSSDTPDSSAQILAADSDDVLGIVTLGDINEEAENSFTHIDMSRGTGQGRNSEQSSQPQLPEQSPQPKMPEQSSQLPDQSPQLLEQSIQPKIPKQSIQPKIPEQNFQPQLPIFSCGNAKPNGIQANGCDARQQTNRGHQLQQQQAKVSTTPSRVPETARFDVMSRDQMQIFVVDIRGKTHTITVNKTDKVDDLMKKIENKAGVNERQQNLQHHNKPLQRGRFLTEYGIQKESTIYMTACLRGGYATDNTKN